MYVLLIFSRNVFSQIFSLPKNRVAALNCSKATPVDPAINFLVHLKKACFNVIFAVLFNIFDFEILFKKNYDTA